MRYREQATTMYRDIVAKMAPSASIKENKKYTLLDLGMKSKFIHPHIEKR